MSQQQYSAIVFHIAVNCTSKCSCFSVLLNPFFCIENNLYSIFIIVVTVRRIVVLLILLRFVQLLKEMQLRFGLDLPVCLRNELSCIQPKIFAKAKNLKAHQAEYGILTADVDAEVDEKKKQGFFII